MKKENMILNVERQLIKFGITNIEDFVVAIFEKGQSEDETINNLCRLFPQLNKDEVTEFVKNYSWN